MKYFVSWLTSFTRGIAFLLIAFAIGIGSIYVWFDVSPPKVTLCQLAKYPEWYNGKTVSVEADGDNRNGSFIISDDDCHIAFNSVRVWLDESYQPSNEAQTFHQNSPTEVHKAHVVVTGRFDGRTKIDRRDCSNPRWAIRAIDVQFKSAIITETIELPKGNEQENKEENKEENDDVGGFTLC